MTMLVFFTSQTRIYDANWKITNFHSVLLKHILLLKHKLFSATLKTPPMWNTQPHLAIFDKIGVDWTPPIAPRSPLQIVQIRLVSLWRADDDGGLGDGTVTSSVGWKVEHVAFILQQEFVSLIALHGVERRSDLRRGARGAWLRVCQIPEVKVYAHLGFRQQPN